MPTTPRRPDVVDLVETKARRVMAEVQASLDPEKVGPEEARALSRAVSERLAGLPPDQAAILRQRVGLAVDDLQALVAEMRAELERLGADLKSAVAHTNASAAYGRRRSGGAR